jgi:RHS repeat-associated protein
VEGNRIVRYSYGADGNRAVKYSERGETFYFNSMWQSMATGSRQSKHIYVGTERIVTRLGDYQHDTTAFNKINTYYYHGDHLGSAQYVTDWEGEEYERNEYTPYGELWIEKRRDEAIDRMPFKFTGKELDEETGLYYYGARYLDPKASRWISADPALGEYLPGTGRGRDLPGMGGVYNLVNMQVYHYAGNNPVRYIDPDGRVSIDTVQSVIDITGALYLYLGPTGFFVMLGCAVYVGWMLWDSGVLPKGIELGKDFIAWLAKHGISGFKGVFGMGDNVTGKFDGSNKAVTVDIKVDNSPPKPLPPELKDPKVPKTPLPEYDPENPPEGYTPPPPPPDDIFKIPPSWIEEVERELGIKR